MSDSPAFARTLLGAGAAGCALKELADSDLPRAVRAAADGEEYVSPRIAGRLRTPSGGWPRAASKEIETTLDNTRASRLH